MRLTAIGQLMLWLSLGLLAAGFLFEISPVLLLGSLIFTCILIDGLYCERSFQAIKTLLAVKSTQDQVSLAIGRTFTLPVEIINKSKVPLTITKLNLQPSPGLIGDGSIDANRAQLRPDSKVTTSNRVTARNAGRFDVGAVGITFELGQHLFSQRIQFKMNTIFIAYPPPETLTEPLQTAVLAETSSDPLRRGPGTDLAGLRPTSPRDDFHLIDWKATARMGRLMTKEYYLETDVPIMMVLDCSTSMNNDRHGNSTFNTTVENIDHLVSNIRISNPLGLALFSETRALAILTPRQGFQNRENIRRILVEHVVPSYEDAAEDMVKIAADPTSARGIRAMAEELKLSSGNRPYKSKTAFFAQTLLPFYEYAEKRRSARLRKLGVFQVFEEICRLPQRILVILITDGKTNMSAYNETVGMAASMGHRVIIAIVSPRESQVENSTSGVPPGAIVIRCRPTELRKAVSRAVLELGHARSVLTER